MGDRLANKIASVQGEAAERGGTVSLVGAALLSVGHSGINNCFSFCY